MRRVEAAPRRLEWARRAGPLAAAVCLSAGPACVDISGRPESEENTGTFVAVQRDFEDFRSWESFDLGTGPIEGHPAGKRVVYLRERPPPGASEFPVGTLIVKATAAELPPQGWVIHAMAKRGGEYNRAGARGWEWFELQINDDDIPVLVWRGTGPPVGEGYGPGGTECNDCHMAAKDRDYVMSDALSLEGP